MSDKSEGIEYEKVMRKCEVNFWTKCWWASKKQL